MNSELQQVLSQLDIPAEWVGMRAVRQASTYRAVRDEQPQENHRGLEQGVMVEVMAQGQMGYGAVNSFQPDAIRAAAETAYQQAIAASKWRIFSMTPAVRPPVTERYASPVQKPLDTLSPGEISEILVRLCQSLKVSEAIVRTSAVAVTEDIDTWFVSSNGSDAYEKLVLTETHFGATAQDGAVVQQRSNNGFLAHSYQGGWERFLGAQLWERAEQVGAQALELLAAEECPTTTTTLVLAPDQMMLQIHESIGHPL